MKKLKCLFLEHMGTACTVLRNQRMEEIMMDTKILEIAQRIKELREILEISVDEMASATDTAPAEYQTLESGEQDFNFTFLHKCAERFGVDIVELLTGENPHLSFFTVTRKGEGVALNRRSGFHYQHMAHNLKNKLCEPFVVTALYSEEDQNKPIPLSTHEGQEFDYVLNGTLKVRVEDHVVVLREGDSIMYDSSHSHGMIAVDGCNCTFIAIVIKR